MPEQDDEGFLLRWSRRKRAAAGDRSDAPPEAAADNAEPAEIADDPLSTQDAEATEQGGETDEAVPAELADVDIDALDYDSDYTRFLGEGVPEALKRRALRQLWRSNPILANVDGLNDYDDDFTDAAMVVDVLKTAHKVGRGYLTDDDAEDEAEREDEGGADNEPSSGEAVAADDNRDSTNLAETDGAASLQPDPETPHDDPARDPENDAEGSKTA